MLCVSREPEAIAFKLRPYEKSLKPDGARFTRLRLCTLRLYSTKGIL
jgi:hypothetical protein